MEKQTGSQTVINNAFYQTLGDDWYERDDHPIALLERENRARSPWLLREMEKRQGARPQKILDVGCGAGFLANYLAKHSHLVTGIDISPSSLEIGRKYDETESVTYLEASAYSLPFPDESFDVVSALDILEHVENPALVIQEASRVLKKGGLFFFHTFNRTWLSYLLVIKGVEWFVKNAPPNMHVYPLFITPKELRALCEKTDLQVESLVGLAPNIKSKGFWKLIYTRSVPSDFTFSHVKSLGTGYSGVARKRL